MKRVIGLSDNLNETWCVCMNISAIEGSTTAWYCEEREARW